jgi:hypothetical protein
MSSKKQKIPKKVSEQTRSISKEKRIPVAEDSLQTKPPGAGPGARQAGTIGGGLHVGESDDGIRGGAGAQQGGWSARQQAERIEARAEEVRLGQPQQSGYGGLEQDQHAGSEESPVGPPRERQTAEPHGSKQQIKSGGNWPQTGSQSKQKGGGSKQ